ncbi:MAG: hypothetical protein ACYS7M_12145 [Planctomycetota bacterium]|jgi:hypothetical protein
MPEPSLNRQTVPVRRDEAGRFVEGTAPGPGRQDLADRGRYLRAVKAAVTHDDLVDVLKSMVSQATDGDVAAGRLICEYTLGKPAQSITLQAEDGPAYKVLLNINEDEL